MLSCRDLEADAIREAAERGCRLVFVSTSGTVGCFRDPAGSADEASPFCEAEVGGWPYYRSKIDAEREARRLADQLGVRLVIMRPPVLLGPPIVPPVIPPVKPPVVIPPVVTTSLSRHAK